MELNTDSSIFIVADTKTKAVQFILDLLKLFGASVRMVKSVDYIQHIPTDCLILWDFESYPAPSDIVKEINEARHMVFNANKERLNENEFLVFGYRGVVYSDDSAALVTNAVNWVADGDLWFSRKTLSRCVVSLLKKESPFKQEVCQQTATLFEELTRQERNIARLLFEGAANKDVANSLSISIHTVKVHVHNIYRKLNVKNRVEAMNLAKKIQPLLRHGRKVRKQPRVKQK